MQKNTAREKFHISWKGMAMGWAEVIPGVSGGTIAFITGIYERLLNVINSIRPSLWRTYREEGGKGVWKAIDGPFITALLFGMIIGLVTGIFGLTWLLENYPEILWGFFLGLILASAVFIGKQIASKKLLIWIIGFIGVWIAYKVSVIIPIQVEPSIAYIIFSGAIAICALLLPGISGSFILLILGMYTVVIPVIKEIMQDPLHGPWSIFIPFVIGCLIGLFSIAKILSWTFYKYRNQTLALLTGFMLGSVNKLWPWRNPVEWIDKTTGLRSLTPDISDEHDWVVVVEQNVLPHAYEGNTHFILVVLAFLLGLSLLFFMGRKIKI
jgi:putative membrane protein